MSDEIKRVADWEPGTLDKTRKNIGNIDSEEAAIMAKKLGGEVLYEKSTSSYSNNSPSKNTGKIIRNASSSSSSSSNSSSNNNTPKRRTKEELPVISKKTNSTIEKLMMSPEHKIKQNYGFFNFMRSWQKNGTEKILPYFYEYTLKHNIEHLEGFTTVIKTLIQMAPSTYKTKIASGTEPKYKFLRMVASWSVQSIKSEYAYLQTLPVVLTTDLIPIVRAIFKPIVTVYYYGNNKIPKLIKEIYSDETAYPDSPQDKLSALAKEAITEESL